MFTVLVVDDAMADRMLMSGLLSRSLDCEILEAENGRAALSVVAESRPDVVLTDLHMPEMDGLELVGAMQEDYPQTPVILMTAQGSEEIAAKALRLGAASYVPKRKCSEELPDTVMRVLAGTHDQRIDPRVLHYLLDGTMRFSLTNDPLAMDALAGLLQQSLRCLPLGSETERVRVGLALEAGLSNACFRGNLELTRDETSDRQSLVKMFQTRVNQAPYRDRRIEVSAVIDREQARFVIHDDGPGFDASEFVGAELERLPDSESNGRGIALMQSIMDEVSWNESGNELTLVKRRYVPADDE